MRLFNAPEAEWPDNNKNHQPACESKTKSQLESIHLQQAAQQEKATNRKKQIIKPRTGSGLHDRQNKAEKEGNQQYLSAACVAV